MQVKTIAEYPKGIMMRYFRSSLSYHLSLRSLFCLFLSGCFTHVLLYFDIYKNNKVQALKCELSMNNVLWSHVPEIIKKI